MRLHNINLENIRSYVSEEIVFPEGKVLLWGNIGSGKSSVLHAIDFVLFGLQRTDLSGTSLLRNGAEEGSVELFFSLEEKDYVLKRALKRTKTGVVQDTGYIIRDGIKEDKTALELKQIVLELLHYPKDLITKNKILIYRYTVYTPQEEMKTILLGPQEERLDTLRKVFGVDKYKRVKENAKILISELKDRKKLYEVAIIDLPEKIDEKNKLEQEIHNFTLKYSEVLTFIQELELQLTQKKDQIIVLEKKREDLTQIKNELALCSIQVSHIKTEREGNIIKEQNLEKEIQILQQDNLEINDTVLELVRELEGQILRKEKELMEIESKKEIFTQVLKDQALCNMQLTHTEKEKDTHTQREQLLIQEIATLQGEELELQGEVKEGIKHLDRQSLIKEKELREILNRLQEFKTRKQLKIQTKQKIESLNECPTCFQEVSLEYKQKFFDHSSLELNTFDVEMQNAEKKQKTIEIEIQAIRSELEILKKKEHDMALIYLKIQHLEKKKEELGVIQKNIVDIYSKILGLEERKKELETQQEMYMPLEQFYLDTKKNLERFRAERELLRKREQDLALIQLKIQNRESKIQELSTIKQRNEKLDVSLSLLEKQKQDLEQKQESLVGLEEIYSTIKQEIEMFLDKIHKMKLEKNQLEIAKKHSQIFLDRVEKEIQKMKVIREKKEYTNKVQFWLTDYFTPLMENMEKNILFKVHAEFTSLFEKWFAILIDNQNLQMSLDEEYSPKINQNGYDIAYEYLSGGEKTAGALAYRLALNQVINNLNVGLKTQDLLILDEPTDGFSSEQLDRLKILFEEIKIPQIILVSHESQIECFAEHIIRFEKREHITKVIS